MSRSSRTIRPTSHLRLHPVENAKTESVHLITYYNGREKTGEQKENGWASQNNGIQMILLSATVVNLRHVKHRSTRLSSLSSCFVFRVLLISITFSYFRCRRHTHIWTVARSAMPWHRFHYIHYLSVEVGFQWIGTATLRPPFWIFGLKLRRLPTNRNSRLARTKLKNIKQGVAWFPNSSTNDNPPFIQLHPAHAFEFAGETHFQWYMRWVFRFACWMEQRMALGSPRTT